MFERFALRHIPALFVASVTLIGVLWPIFNPRRSPLEFGFPAHIVESPTAAPVMLVVQVRTTTIGLVMFMLYSRGQMDVLDLIIAVFGLTARVVDSYAVWKQGNTRKAVYRLVVSWTLAGCGLSSMTAGHWCRKAEALGSLPDPLEYETIDRLFQDNRRLA
ncbi:hypothetical protein F5Y08DRAFT_245271 [Xylaria arbuscula]|nr:hypothetical protein F5Y08DRAFT_245271 [Xylaria arbuscula]